MTDASASAQTLMADTRPMDRSGGYDELMSVPYPNKRDGGGSENDGRELRTAFEPDLLARGTDAPCGCRNRRRCRRTSRPQRPRTDRARRLRAPALLQSRRARQRSEAARARTVASLETRARAMRDTMVVPIARPLRNCGRNLLESSLLTSGSPVSVCAGSTASTIGLDRPSAPRAFEGKT